MKVKTNNEKETKEVAKKIAKLVNKNNKRATVITLSGDLGSGKTTFTKGFADYFNISEITSPTFVIMKKYELDGFDFNNFYHVDCYRLEEKSTLDEINFNEVLSDANNIVLIEWAERLKQIPERSINLKFKVLEGKKRLITIPNSLGLKK